MVAPALRMPKIPPAPDPADREALWYWSYVHFGIKLAIHPTCRGHHSPYQIFHYKYQNAPPNSVVHGPRGGGKSMMAGLGAHLRCRRDPGYGVNILGGSKQQSRQVAEAMADHIAHAPVPGGARGDAATLKLFGKEQITYRNGSSMSILAASSRSVRGPHDPHLILDEIDEQDPTLAGAALGMVQGYKEKGFAPIIENVSTWHKVGGFMQKMLEKARETHIPIFTFCMFEVLERCPDSYSGRRLENCPKCPIYQYCWADRFNDKRLLPRAKISNGHYTFDTMLAKVHALTPREFEADYLSLGPKVEGAWFPNYHDGMNVSERAEYNPNLKVYVSIDYGVRTGAVFFQVATGIVDGRLCEEVHVFADFYSEMKTPEHNAGAIREIAWERCQARLENVSMDSAADSPEGAGTTGLREYAKAGFPQIKPWRHQTRKRKLNSLDTLNSFILTAAGTRHLYVHPRCKHTRDALASYRRAKVGTTWGDEPADPQHPHEEVIDALCGQLDRLYPLGRIGDTEKKPLRVSANRMA